MTHRFVLISFVLALVTLAACTDTAAPDDPTRATGTTEVAAREWQCVPVCFPASGVPCRTFCTLTLDEPGFVIVQQETTCSRGLRPINICGDGCCDSGETFIGGEYCANDCRIERLEIVDLEGRGRLSILSNEREMGSIDERSVTVAPVCQ